MVGQLTGHTHTTRIWAADSSAPDEHSRRIAGCVRSLAFSITQRDPYLGSVRGVTPLKVASAR